MSEDQRSASGVDKRIGERVRARRLEIGMSQERLAEILGVTFQQVQKYEKGVNRIAASRLFDISAALDMPIADFFRGLAKGSDARSGGASSMDQALAQPGAVELLRLYTAIESPKVRQRLLKLVRAMKDGE